jgi:hypothetical protein
VYVEEVPVTSIRENQLEAIGSNRTPEEWL